MNGFKDTSSRRSFLQRSSAGMLAVGTAWAQPPQTARTPVVLGQVSLSFYAVAGAVVQEVLSRLGHAVQVRSGPHEAIFPLLGESAIDLMVAAWLPEGHADYWDRYGGAAQEVARLYDGAHFFWAVPDYVPASEVGSIADLAKPAVAARMAKPIQGIGAGAAITTLSQQALERYGLERAGYTLRAGTAADWIAAYEAARSQRQWIVFPTWAPHYLNRAGGGLRPIQDPRRVLGGMNHAAVVAPKLRFQALPPRTRTVLEKIRLSLEVVTDMDYTVNIGKRMPQEAARAWMAANAATVDSWLAV